MAPDVLAAISFAAAFVALVTVLPTPLAKDEVALKAEAPASLVASTAVAPAFLVALTAQTQQHRHRKGSEVYQ